MKYTKWNDDWKFWKDKDSFALVWKVPENAENIRLPHDAMIIDDSDPESPGGTNTGFRNAECYSYVKIFKAEPEWKNKITRIVFEGVYMNAFVYLNGQFLAKSPSGYATFTADLTDFLRYDSENELRVLVRSGAMPNSRWYSGAGIYRDVYLLQSSKVHIAQDGLKILTEEAGPISVISTEIKIENDSDQSLELSLFTSIGNDKKEKTLLFLPAKKSRLIKRRITVENAELWSDENPRLYTAKAELFSGNKNPENNPDDCLDSAEESFGIRKISLDAKRGLRINGKEVKLRGACIHHDSGILGAATYEEVQYRQIKILKDAGFNAIRMSHQPAAQAMLRACDSLGMYVMDEFSDMWTRMKSSYDYGLFFEEWWQKDVSAMVNKDFNHPCVILYSIGNEIPEIGTDGGSQYAHEISSLFRSLDSSRFITAGINGVFAAGDAIGKIIGDVLREEASASDNKGSDSNGNVNDFMTLMDQKMDKIVVHKEISTRLEKACGALDLAGYNYMRARYQPDSKKYPDRVIVGSETYPPDIAKNWAEVKKLHNVIGDFTWTGWDYIGEAGVGIPCYKAGEGGFGAKFPAQLAYCGDIDITGFRRPMSYLREIVFGLREKPYIAVQDPRHYGEKLIKTPWILSDCSRNWTFRDWEGKKALVEVYSAGDTVELFLNDVSLGKKPAGEKADFRVLYDVKIEKGCLKAISYENGKVIGEDILYSCGKERKLKIDVENTAGEKTGQNKASLVFLNISLTDEYGNTLPDSDTEVNILTKGNISLLALGSGNPKPDRNYTGNTGRLWQGRAFAIVEKTTSLEGEISVSAKELSEVTVKV